MPARRDRRPPRAALPADAPAPARTPAQLGDSNVGKSSLVNRFVKNQFNTEHPTTVGAAFLQTPVPLEDSADNIQFGIWDTAGSERYKALAPMYYRGAEAAIIVYDITSFESFEGAKSWVHDLKLYGQPNVVIALAANKCAPGAEPRPCAPAATSASRFPRGGWPCIAACGI